MDVSNVAFVASSYASVLGPSYVFSLRLACPLSSSRPPFSSSSSSSSRRTPYKHDSSSSVFTSLALWLKRLRPVLSNCWIQCGLNSLPTAGWLHDNGFGACPFCSALPCDATHLITCERQFRLASKVLLLSGPYFSLSHPFVQTLDHTDLSLPVVPLHLPVRLFF